jgi:hypothetical protein
MRSFPQADQAGVVKQLLANMTKPGKYQGPEAMFAKELHNLIAREV